MALPCLCFTSQSLQLPFHLTHIPSRTASQHHCSFRKPELPILCKHLHRVHQKLLIKDQKMISFSGTFRFSSLCFHPSITPSLLHHFRDSHSFKRRFTSCSVVPLPRQSLRRWHSTFDVLPSSRVIELIWLPSGQFFFFNLNFLISLVLPFGKQVKNLFRDYHFLICLSGFAEIFMTEVLA